MEVAGRVAARVPEAARVRPRDGGGSILEVPIPRAPGVHGTSTNPVSREPPELPCAELVEERADWRSQFALRRGVIGHLAGWLMARKNAPMNAALVEWLAPAPGERVLELGFGHGRTLARLAERAAPERGRPDATGPTGFVAGVDPSDTMLRQAGRWNRRAIAAGRMRLAKGDARGIPFPDGSLDRVLAANCVEFWGDLAAALAEIRRVLAAQGTLLIGIRVHDPAGGRFVSPGFRENEIDAVRVAVERPGFRSLRVLRCHAGRDIVGLHASR